MLKSERHHKQTDLLRPGDLVPSPVLFHETGDMSAFKVILQHSVTTTKAPIHNAVPSGDGNLPRRVGAGAYPGLRDHDLRANVQEVHQSLPLDPLGPGAADLLAGDVEYRLHFLLQEAKKFMVHGKRTTLLPEDVEHAMEALSVEPVIVPPRPLPQAPFHAVPVPGGSQGPAGQLYHEIDDEIDFATYLKEPLPPALANSAGVKWKAHWLAVEGVQPAIPENPAPTARSGPTRPQPTTGSAALRQNAKTHLTTELQLYFSRLTAALVPSTAALAQLPRNPAPGSTAHAFPEAERHRLAALASVRSDAAVAGVLAYLIRWVSESITKCLMGATGTIGCLIDVVEAILDNDVLFVEPYVSTPEACDALLSTLCGFRS